MILAAATLGQRELVRFFRQKNRVIGALAPPLIFWLLLGMGFSGSFRHEGSLSYLQYFFPGTVVMVVLFAAIFSTISIIEDRKEGFLQSVLVSPAPRASIALGKIWGGSAIAFLHAVFFLLLSPWIGAHLTPAGALYGAAILAGISFGLTALGFLIAWRMDSTQGFHSVMNLFLMPLWFLSGAVFPVATAPAWLKGLMMANPLTYGVEALRSALFPPAAPSAASPVLCLSIILAFAAVMFILSVFVCARQEAP
ncbi:MAG: hypothetical protein A3A86_01355 [Elusimicrobia bacterium RIFCSPLOWO2_01_FULL_60_11]|nr:MAG: hypothetical protein A3A86_01355 [Elusimicrobia bacterium RIFCSPLOWO2_01_FULL_60_11]